VKKYILTSLESLMGKVLVLGIDCAEPSQIETWIDELPTLKQLYQVHYCRVNSTIPPITIPAWLCAFSGLNPGDLGLYDLKVRKPRTYTEFQFYHYGMVRDFEFIWNFTNKLGKKVILCFVPGTYPPPKIKGIVISDFFTPSIEASFTWPPFIKKEILNLVDNNYIIDVYDYKRKDPKQLYKELMIKLEQDFKIMKYLLRRYNWDLFIGVIMSIDRAQHTLWKFFDKEHPRYVHDPELENGLLNLYRKIDQELREIMTIIPKDTSIIIMSDHGAKRMYYRVNINEVLAQEGLLKLKERPKKAMTLEEANRRGLIDWDRTIAWAWGAYVGQIWINLKGREEKGIVEKEHYEDVCKQIANLLISIKGIDGKGLDNKVYFKWNVYRGSRVEYMPDITIYYDNLHYGVNDMIGLNDIYSLEALKGIDDSNHAEKAIFMSDVKVDVNEVSHVFNVLSKLLQ